jgi:hypothetical protein
MLTYAHVVSEISRLLRLAVTAAEREREREQGAGMFFFL